ncbi:MAG TPA: hypothetical protein DCE13_06200 [Cryomorphaceae bacterium]|jgi:SprT protein|nr:hypothetical protein [Cryomorphaceae bacterium]HAB32120.1 hypothetical protein [Cryomorphaceae bacterium]
MKSWALISPRVPESAHPRLERVLRAYSGQVRLAPPRQSKWGDFRWQAGSLSRISINRDLNPEAFLITLLHELAHAQVHAWDSQYRLPHGLEWQRRYRDLVQPFLDDGVFSPAVHRALSLGLRQPKASCGADPRLLKALQGTQENGHPTVESLPEGSLFTVRSGRQFKKGPKRRSRYSCTELGTGRTFAVHPLMEVHPVQNA